MPTGGGIAQRIAAQVVEDACEHVWIGPYRRQVIGQIVARLYVDALELRDECREYFIDQWRESYSAPLRLHGPGLGFGHHVQIFYQAAQAQRFPHNDAPGRLKVLAILADAVRERLAKSGNGSEGRGQ